MPQNNAPKIDPARTDDLIIDTTQALSQTNSSWNILTMIDWLNLFIVSIKSSVKYLSVLISFYMYSRVNEYTSLISKQSLLLSQQIL